MDNQKLWSINRRKFVKGLIAAGIITKIGFLESCSDKLNNNLLLNSFFSDLEMKNLSEIVNRLFPDDGNGPNSNEINVIPHIIWTLQHTEYGFNSFDMLKSAFQKLSDFTSDSFSKSFFELEEPEQIKTLERISEIRWGERFMSNLLTYIFEALSIDPLYSVNANKVGWDWLGHQAGYPRPQESQLYPQFLKRFNDEL